MDLGKRMLKRFTAEACPSCQRHVYGYLRSIAKGGRQRAVAASHTAQIDIYKEWRMLLCPACLALMDRLDAGAARDLVG